MHQVVIGRTTDKNVAVKTISQEGEPLTKELQWQQNWDQVHIPFGVRIELTVMADSRPEGDKTFHREVVVPAGFWGREES